MLRSGAMPGDVLAVTGLFGKSAAGLRLLLDANCVVSSDVVCLVLEGAVLYPCARLAEGLALSQSGGVSACMDSSDGLAWSLFEFMRMSGVGFVVDKLPVAEEVLVFAEQNGLDVERLVLYGGEEYELVLTVNPKNWDIVKSAVDAVGGSLLVIGRVTVEKQLILVMNGEKRDIEPLGFEHFTRV